MNGALATSVVPRTEKKNTRLQGYKALEWGYLRVQHSGGTANRIMDINKQDFKVETLEPWIRCVGEAAGQNRSRVQVSVGCLLGV